MKFTADKENVQGTSESAAHAPPGIGQLAERSLHAGLKEYLVQPGDRFDVKLGRYDDPAYRKLLDAWDPTTGQL